MNLPLISDLEHSSELNTENSSTDKNSSTDTTQKIQKIKTSLFKQERERLSKIFQQIRKANTQEQFLKNTVTIIRQTLAVDRVLIYRCADNNSGKVIAESIVNGWTPTQDETIPCACFGGLKHNDYHSQEFIAIEDLESNRLTPHQKQLLVRFQVQASLAIPILLDSYFLEGNAYGLNQIWGLVVVHQCSQSRQWQEEEINLLSQLSAELTRVLQPPLPRLRSGKESDFLTVIDREMQQSMQQRLNQIRQLLKVDRALVYGFNPDWSGKVLAESVDAKWSKAGSSFDHDCFLTEENCQDRYVVNDIYQQNFAPCLIEAYEAMEAKAYMAIPVKLGDRLLGMLVVYQNSNSRTWEKSEIQLITDYANKFSPDLQQTASIRHLQFQAKQLQKSSDQDFLTSINQEAQQSMQSWLDKIRQSMKLDRAVVYGFNPDWSGEVLAESFGSNWNPTGSVLDRDFHFKGGSFEPYYIANDVQSKGLARAVLEKFEQMQARAYIVMPIHVNNQLLGVLGVYQNSGPRNWQESEVMQVQQYATRFIKPLEQTSYWRNSQFQQQQLEKAFKREKSLSQILEKVRLAKDEQAVLQISTNEGRKILDVDRVAVYRFNEDWSGNFIAESAAPGWSNLLEIIPFIEDTFLQNTKGGRYKNGETFSVEDIYLAGHKECHIELLEQMEARAYVLAPIFIADSNMFGSKKLWGLIGCYQNSGARRWQNYEIDTLRQLGLQVGIALQQSDYLGRLEKQAEQEKASNRIIEKIRKASDIDEIFTVTTQELRKVIKADRTVVYQFNEDWSGQVVAESVGGDWVSLLVEQEKDKILSGNRTQSDRCVLRKWSVDDITDTDTYLKRNKGGKYTQGEKFTAVNDIYKMKFPDCYIASLEKYQAKAYIITPIFQDNKLWGLLGIYQNSSSRNWQESETEQMVQIANQLGIALQQATYVEQLKTQAEKQALAVQQAQATTTIINKIVESQDVDTIFKVSTKEVRKVLKTDRTVIYQFNEDWSGQVVAESVDSGWVSLLKEQINDEVLSGDRTSSERCILRKWSAGDITGVDTYLQQTQGGRYVKGKKVTIIDDIYTQDFPDCYIESLEKYQARAYLIAPIFQENKLWGLLGAYQNSGPRTWEESEARLITQIASQLAVAIQQASYVEQIKIQTEELEKTIQRERSAKEELQKQAVDMLRTVRPAFSGDLTVRANVTENEIGTIAGAYNTTLDSLKDIVLKVQTAVEHVAQTTGTSSVAVEGLSLQSQKQLQELQQALTQIEAMSDASAITTKNAQQVESAIEQADLTVQEGDRAMNDTVDSILGIRQTVADAVKRVKPLSDSSQKISRVVNLIGSFATQTNLLALNAALEATRAGEYGKGFAVVADEVRNLSLQSSEATTEIEKLVREIQEETQEVALAMDAGIEQVSQGTSLVNQTRESLNAIVTATAEIRHLVQDITSAANAQTEQAESVTQVMGQVADIANETSTGSQNISASFQELQQLAQNLQSSVAQFKVK